MLAGSVSVLTCLLLGGCAFTDATVDIKPSPVFTAPLTADGYAFRLGPVLDRRPDTSRIGCKKSGLGGESAGIFLSVPLDQWFSEQLSLQLQAAGLRPARSGEDNAVRIELDVLNFFTEPDMGLTIDIFAVVHAEIRVYFPDGSTFARRFAATNDHIYLTLSAGNFVEMLEQTVNNWMRQAVPEVVKLIKAHAGGRLQASGWSTQS